MKSTKIDWCDCTENAVVGCPNGCEYCYARRLNNRFNFVENWDNPKFFPERLKKFSSKKPKSVFIDSMSDIGCWKDEWLEQVLSAMSENPQHRYIALTKTNTRNFYKKLIRYEIDHPKKVKLYLGKSVTNQEQYDKMVNGGEIVDFLSIEPLHGAIKFRAFGYRNILNAKVVIIGAETGNRKGKIIPQKEWVDDIVKQCDRAKVAVFMKESLKELMGEDFRQDKLPWDVR